MREILFRGRDIKGNWHIGLLSHQGNAWYISNKAGIATAFEVAPSTIGQYTGLADKNGRKIFEGDIVKIPLYRNDFGVVKYSAPECCFYYEMQGDKDDVTMEEWCSDVEVIGNIHDNPDLLSEV